VCQLPEAFNVPREHPPDHFHCIGRFQDSSGTESISFGNAVFPFERLNGQLVISPGNRKAPLIELSQVIVTHAGMNTVLTALGCGVTPVAIPITNEQPGIASRLARTKAGKTLKLIELSETTHRTTMTEVLSEPSYRNNAQKMQKIIQESGGVVQVVAIIEKTA
jgi:UDP-N-acetylglucosamine:LPS N-acetylglucosamine transferase